jgi:hypothetical protein
VQSSVINKLDFIANSQGPTTPTEATKRAFPYTYFFKGNVIDTSRKDFVLVRFLNTAAAEQFSLVGVKNVFLIAAGQGIGGGSKTDAPIRTSNPFTKTSKTSISQTNPIKTSYTTSLSQSQISPTKTSQSAIIPVKNVTDALVDPNAKISKDDAKLFLESIGEQRQELDEDKFFTTVDLIASALYRNSTTGFVVESSTISIAVTPISSNQSINLGFTSSRSEVYVPQEVLETAGGIATKAVFSSFEFNPFESIDNKTEL